MKQKKQATPSDQPSTHRNTSQHNGKMTLYEDPVDRELGTMTTSLTHSDHLHSYDFVTSPPPLILRSYPSFQSSTHSSTKQSQQQPTKSKDLPNQSINSNKQSRQFSSNYIHRLIEQNERRYEQQEHNTTIGQEWQILSRVVDRLLALIFVITTMLVFLFIFRQAPLLRLK